MISSRTYYLMRGRAGDEGEPVRCSQDSSVPVFTSLVCGQDKVAYLRPQGGSPPKVIGTSEVLFSVSTFCLRHSGKFRRFAAFSASVSLW